MCEAQHPQELSMTQEIPGSPLLRKHLQLLST